MAASPNNGDLAGGRDGRECTFNYPHNQTPPQLPGGAGRTGAPLPERYCQAALSPFQGSIYPASSHGLRHGLLGFALPGLLATFCLRDFASMWCTEVAGILGVASLMESCRALRRITK